MPSLLSHPAQQQFKKDGSLILALLVCCSHANLQDKSQPNFPTLLGAGHKVESSLVFNPWKDLKSKTNSHRHTINVDIQLRMELVIGTTTATRKLAAVVDWNLYVIVIVIVDGQH